MRTRSVIVLAWSALVLAVGVTLLVTAHVAAGVGVLVVGALAPVIVFYRHAELTPPGSGGR